MRSWLLAELEGSLIGYWAVKVAGGSGGRGEVLLPPPPILVRSYMCFISWRHLLPRRLMPCCPRCCGPPAAVMLHAMTCDIGTLLFGICSDPVDI